MSGEFLGRVEKLKWSLKSIDRQIRESIEIRDGKGQQNYAYPKTCCEYKKINIYIKNLKKKKAKTIETLTQAQKDIV